MRVLLVTLLLSSLGHADVRSAWRNFCERHLIADAPAWMDAVDVTPSSTTIPLAKKLELIDEYRLTGGQLFWMAGKNPKFVNQTQAVELQSRLRVLGLQIRRLRAGATGEFAEKITDALLDYQSFEAASSQMR